MEDRLIGIAYAAERFHSGQWSRGYRLLSKIRWSPGTDRAWRLQPKEDWQTARDWAAHYVRRARKEKNLF